MLDFQMIIKVNLPNKMPNRCRTNAEAQKREKTKKRKEAKEKKKKREIYKKERRIDVCVLPPLSPKGTHKNKSSKIHLRVLHRWHKATLLEN